MRKKIKKYLESFRAKCFNENAKKVLKQCRMYLHFIVLMLISSCSVQNVINKDDFKSIPASFSADFYDKPDTISVQNNSSIRVRSLIKEFTECNTIDYSKPIKIQIKKKELFLQFMDESKKAHVLKFYGKRFEKRFIFYTNYETISFPILFINKEVTKYSVYLSDEGEIIFSNHNVNEGMVLLFGAGNSYNKDYKFKLLKNE